MDFQYLARYGVEDLFRFSVLWHRKTYCHIASPQQSGTHWLSNLLATAICSEYDVPPPQHIADKVIIGHPKNETTYKHIPQLVRTHHAPSILVHSLPGRALFQFPKYIILLRDIRASLVSRFEKRKREKNVEFPDYLRDHRLFGRAHKWDIYKRIVFFNAWGRVAQLFPEQTCIVHYELLRQDTAGELERVWRFLELPVSNPAMFHHAAHNCSKEAMSRQEQPDRKRDLVRKDPRDPVEWFSQSDREYFTACCQRLLKHDFGYDFTNWESARLPPVRQQTAVARSA